MQYQDRHDVATTRAFNLDIRLNASDAKCEETVKDILRTSCIKLFSDKYHILGIVVRKVTIVDIWPLAKDYNCQVELLEKPTTEIWVHIPKKYV